MKTIISHFIIDLQLMIYIAHKIHHVDFHKIIPIIMNLLIVQLINVYVQMILIQVIDI